VGPVEDGKHVDRRKKVRENVQDKQMNEVVSFEQTRDLSEGDRNRVKVQTINVRKLVEGVNLSENPETIGHTLVVEN
jgi:hypothetical protein